jgi:hypothetical protein
MAQPFEAKTLKLSGEAVPVAEQVRAFSVSKGGDLMNAGGAARGCPTHLVRAEYPICPAHSGADLLQDR